MNSRRFTQTIFLIEKMHLKTTARGYLLAIIFSIKYCEIEPDIFFMENIISFV